MDAKHQVKQHTETAAAPVRLRVWLLKPLILLLSATWVLAVLIRITVRDAGGLVSTLIFYLSPPVLLCLSAAIVFLLCWQVQWRRLSLIWLLLTLGATAYCWNSQIQRHRVSMPAAENQRAIRVQFWNIGDRIWGMNHVLSELRAVDADLIGLVEAGGDSDRDQQFWKTAFPDHPYQSVHQGLVLLSRFPLSNRKAGRLASMGRYQQFDLSVTDSREATVSVYLVDINSDIFRSRQAALDALARHVSPHRETPVLVLGDFNTPTDSVHFQPLRKSLRNSLDVAGNGYTPTWPLPLPVLDLDGIWGNESIRFLAAENRWTWVSDHRPVVAQIELSSPQK